MLVADSQSRPSRTSNSFEPYRLARTYGERLAAFQLVYRSYLEAGLGTRNVFGMRVTPFQLLDSSQIFIASEPDQARLPELLPPRYAFLSSDRPSQGGPGFQGSVVSTMTLVGDDTLGLPIESMFGAEVEALRRERRQLAEVACLADSASDPRKFLQSFTQLTRVLLQYSRQQRVQNLLISVHPRHAKFYVRYFGFRPLGSRVANCPHAKNRPAVGLNLDLELYDLEKPRSWHAVFGIPISRDKLRPSPIPRGEAQLLREVARVVSATQHLLPPKDQRAAGEALRAA